NNAYALWKAGCSLQELSQLLPAEIPAPEPVSELQDGRVPQPIELDPSTPIYSLPFHLGHQFLHDTQLCVTGQLHFVQTALAAMGLQTHADVSLHEITPELLAHAGFARSNEDMNLWLKPQLRHDQYWVFHTGHPTMHDLHSWYVQNYRDAFNYELAPTWMIFESANEAIRARQQASVFSTTQRRTSDHLLGPATTYLTTYQSTQPLSATRRPSLTSSSHYSSTRYFQPQDSRTTHLHEATQERYQVPAQVTLPSDFISSSHSSQTTPFTTEPIRIPVIIDLAINRPDPRDLQVNLYPQIEQRQELPFYVAPQMPQTALPMYVAPQLTQTTLPMHIAPQLPQARLPMHIEPHVARATMPVHPS
ncbi:MAG: hypothetical protein ACRC9T_07045, partial [Vibrionaceae bacterium]